MTGFTDIGKRPQKSVSTSFVNHKDFFKESISVTSIASQSSKFIQKNQKKLLSSLQVFENRIWTDYGWTGIGGY